MNKQNRRAAMVFILMIAVAVNASLSVAADSSNGELLARRWCASCHLVAGNQVQASADIASFAAIARMPNFTPEKIAFFLLDPHPKMPNLELTGARPQISRPISVLWRSRGRNRLSEVPGYDPNRTIAAK